MALGWWWWRARAVLTLERHAVLALVALQVLLGIFTVLQAPIAGWLLWLGFAHQAVGTLLFAALVWARRTLSAPSPA